MSKKIMIILGGDTVPTKFNEEYLANGQDGKVFNRVKDTFLSADICVVNLECPLTTSGTYIKKTGPCLKANPGTITGLINAGIDVFSLANNHIMDFGPEGLNDTMECIVRKQAQFTGAGENLNAARKILTIQNQGYKIAIVSVAEHEFSIAEGNSPGANPFDPFDTIKDIERVRTEVDYVIVLYHGGIEHYQVPSPSLQRICHKMVESGADCLVCQHSHCIGSYEQYLGGHIIYGQGNLLFDRDEDELWDSGLLIKLTIEHSMNEIEFIPIVKKGFAIDLAEDDEKELIIDAFNQRSKMTTDQQYIRKEWQDFANRRKFYYLQTFLGFSDLLKRIDHRLGNIISKFLFPRTNYARLYDYLNCEAHLDIIKSFLKEEHQVKK